MSNKMESCLRKVKVFAGCDWMVFSFIADHAFAIQSKYQSLSGSGMFRKTRAFIKSHHYELHLVVMDYIHIDYFAFH